MHDTARWLRSIALGLCVLAAMPDASAQTRRAGVVRVTRRAGRLVRARRVARPNRVFARALSADDFATPVDRATLRRYAPDLDDADFDARWNESLASPVAFLRANPRAFLADLHPLEGRAPGGRGVVFGDLHPENFGWVRVSGRWHYVFNDLDDGGLGSVAFDAARYFTALRLWGFDDALIRDAFETYQHALSHPARLDATDTTGLPHVPDTQRVAREALAGVTNGDHFVFDASSGLTAVEAGVRTAIVSSLERGDGGLHRYRVLDVAQFHRSHGGSGGLARYWALAERDGERALLEFKQSVDPAVIETVAPDAGQLGFASRLDVLKRAFWGAPAPHQHVYGTLEGHRFLVRDRTGLTHPHLDQLSRSQLRDLIRVQVRQIAAVHAGSWAGASPEEATGWLRDSSATLAARWRSAWSAAR